MRANVLDGAAAWSRSTRYFEQVARERGFYSEELMREIADAAACAAWTGVPEDVRRVFATAHDIAPEWHVRMQAAFQRFTDNAVSKTVNFPDEATAEDVESLPAGLREGLQGRDHLPRRQPRGAGAQRRPDEEEARGGAQRPRRPRGPRDRSSSGETQRMETGCGKLYVTINEDENGPCEVFANMGKAGGCASSNTEAMGRLISLALKRGASAAEVVEQLKGIRCHVPYGFGPNAILSCADAIGKAIERRYVLGGGAATVEPQPQLSLVEVAQGACPDCGGAIEHEGGCVVCRLCGYSKCG